MRGLQFQIPISFIADPGWTYSGSQLQERLTERASWTDRKRRHAPIGPPATMSSHVSLPTVGSSGSLQGVPAERCATASHTSRRCVCLGTRARALLAQAGGWSPRLRYTLALLGGRTQQTGLTAAIQRTRALHALSMRTTSTGCRAVPE
jgi:hypothetical protein